MSNTSPLVTTLMQSEASAAADAVARQAMEAEAALNAVTQRLRRSPPALALTCARGSSDHAAS